MPKSQVLAEQGEVSVLAVVNPQFELYHREMEDVTPHTSSTEASGPVTLPVSTTPQNAAGSVAGGDGSGQSNSNSVESTSQRILRSRKQRVEGERGRRGERKRRRRKSPPRHTPMDDTGM